LLVANCPELITKDLLTKLFVVWRHEKLLEFTTPPLNERDEDDIDEEEDDDDDGDNDGGKSHQSRSQQQQQQQQNRLKVNSFIFSSVISPRFMVMMRGRDRSHFQVYANFLIELIRERFITVEVVNELSVGLYKYEWSKVCCF
jgi:hypothetical protein